MLKRVFNHHRHDIDKVMSQWLLAGNYPRWSHRQNDLGDGPLNIEMGPLKLVFYTFTFSLAPSANPEHVVITHANTSDDIKMGTFYGKSWGMMLYLSNAPLMICLIYFFI